MSGVSDQATKDKTIQNVIFKKATALPAVESPNCCSRIILGFLPGSSDVTSVPQFN